MMTQKEYAHLPWEKRLTYERGCWDQGYKRIAGLDEAGRGPLAGPVVAAVFLITPEFQLMELNDSKQLSLKQRENCFQYLTSGQWEYGVGVVEPGEIDRINIYQASRRAMLQALQSLSPAPDYLLVDALVVPDTSIPQSAIIHGDALAVTIAAASVIAKCTRDRMMIEYDRDFPGYGFAKHKGYPTREHYEALSKLGPSSIHRLSFRLTKKLDSKSLDLFEEAEVFQIED